MLFNPPTIQPQQPIRFPSGATVTEHSLTTATTIILPDRSTVQSRRGLTVYNDGTANALFSYGTSISASSFTAEILPGGWIEDSSSAPWQGSAVMRSTSSPTTVNVTEIVII